MNISKKKQTLIIGIIVLLVIIALIAVVISVRSNSPARRLQQQLDLGQRYMSEMNYEQAIAAFEAAIEIEPNCADAYLGAAEAYIALGDKERAIELLQRGYEITGDDRINNMLSGLLPAEEFVADAPQEETSLDEPSEIEEDTPQAKIEEIYDTISEIWDYDVRGTAFDQWDVDFGTSYLQTNGTLSVESFSDGAHYFLEDGCNAVISSDQSVSIFDNDHDGYYIFRYLDGRSWNDLVYRSGNDKYPILGQSFEALVEQHGMTMEELLSYGQTYDDPNAYNYYLDNHRGEFVIFVFDYDTGYYLIHAFDSKRNHPNLEFRSEDNTITCVSVSE